MSVSTTMEVVNIFVRTQLAHLSVGVEVAISYTVMEEVVRVS